LGIGGNFAAAGFSEEFLVRIGKRRMDLEQSGAAASYVKEPAASNIVACNANVFGIAPCSQRNVIGDTRTKSLSFVGGI
jgi:hypothetical protein